MNLLPQKVACVLLLLVSASKLGPSFRRRAKHEAEESTQWRAKLRRYWPGVMPVPLRNARVKFA